MSDVAESLLVFREQQSDCSWKHDYLLSNEIASSPPAEMSWVYKAEHRIEECIKTAKSEAGLADYQVRTWEGWHHHQCLSLLATWFLCEEGRRGNNTDARVDGARAAGADRRAESLEIGQQHGLGLRPQVEHPLQVVVLSLVPSRPGLSQGGVGSADKRERSWSGVSWRSCHQERSAGRGTPRRS